MPKCPNCGSTNLRPDPKNPGKVLCYGCRKRIPETALVPDDEPVQAPTPTPAPAQQPQPQPRPQEPQFQQPQPQPQQWQQPSQTGGFERQGAEYAQPQPQVPYGQQPQQQWQQPQGAYAPQPPDVMAQAQQTVAANGGKAGLFSHLLVMPDQARLAQMGATGLGNTWFKALVYVLLFLSAASYAFSAIQSLLSILGSFRFGFNAIALVAALLMIAIDTALCVGTLLVRKRMALFTKGSWADMIGVFSVSAAASLLEILWVVIFYGFSGPIWASGLATALFTLIVYAGLVALNGIYFAKRAQFFDFEDASIGCKASGMEPKVATVFKSVEASMQPVPGNAPGQQWQQQPQPQPQQQWQQQPQQQWQQPQGQQQWQQPSQAGGFAQPQSQQQWQQPQGQQGAPQGQQGGFSQPQAPQGGFGQQGGQGGWQNGSQGF